MRPVDSAAIAELGYEPESATLFVRFRSGEAYAYLDVPAATWRAFERAASKGRFFQSRIDPTYRYVRLG